MPTSISQKGCTHYNYRFPLHQSEMLFDQREIKKGRDLQCIMRRLERVNTGDGHMPDKKGKPTQNQGVREESRTR